MEKRTIRVQPIFGKFCSVTSHGKTIRIWLVDPETLKQGTEVSYEDAIELLALRHPMICLSQEKGEDGKYIEQLSDEEWELIDKKRLEAQNQIAANTLQNNTTSSSSDNSALEKLAETQAKLIENQSKQLETQATQMAEMQKQFAEMQKTLTKLSKKSGKTKDTEETEEASDAE